MPELPEVETRVRQLRGPLLGRTVVGVWNDWPRHIQNMSVTQFADRIRGQQFESAGRRGKFLLFGLTHDTLLIHLRMSGDLAVLPAADPPTRYAHTVLQLDNGSELRFSDSRKFGTVHLVDDAEQVVGHLGPEPLSDDFSADNLQTIVAGRKRPIKALLLDQTMLAGVGNIYANDGLFLAQIHPTQPADSLSKADVERLWHSIRLVLNEGIANNGASLDWVYRGGNQQHNFRVHDRAGEPCPVCGAPIERMVVAQRGTFVCPSCQPVKGKTA